MGRVSQIQRFSTADGAGIRTTVFLQGCNLRCPWCHNPETVPMHGALMFYSDKCSECGACAAVCDCHGITESGHTVDREKCNACGKCAEACLCGALGFSGSDMSAEKVMKKVLADRDFYSESGGGVTLSGGEPLLQPEFCEELCRLCTEEGINVIIDTALCVSREAIEPLLQFRPTFFADIKLPDEASYREICGGSLELVKSNLCFLISNNINTVARLPVIPGVNDTPKKVEEISAVARECGIKQITLIPFHRLGESKYEALGKHYSCAEITPPDTAHIQELQSAATAILKG